MEYEGKEVSPYKGFIGTCIILILFPLAVYAIFYNAIIHFQDLSDELNQYSAIGLGFGVGFLFHISCIFAGLFKGNFGVVVRRVASFFSNLTISFKLAVKCYIEDIRNEGIVFWPYFFIIATNASISVYCLYKFFEIYFK